MNQAYSLSLTILLHELAELGASFDLEKDLVVLLTLNLKVYGVICIFFSHFEMQTPKGSSYIRWSRKLAFRSAFKSIIFQMEIEHKKVVTVKIQWGKKKFDFGWDSTEDLDTIKCRLVAE